MLNPRSIDDPASSWGSVNDNMRNASGDTFEVDFMGYVPIPNSISNMTQEEKDRIVRICVQSVISSQLTDQFKQLLNDQIVGPFFSVDHLKVFLNMTTYNLTFLYNNNGRNLLLGRYRTNKLSHYKIVRENGRIYLGLVMIKSFKEPLRECNVMRLTGELECAEIIKKLEAIDNADHSNVSKFDARVRSTQEFAYKISMIPFYHGNLSRQEAAARLQRPGDFLIRDRTDPLEGHCALSFMDKDGRPERWSSGTENFLKNWQIQPLNNSFKFPVLRPYDE